MPFTLESRVFILFGVFFPFFSDLRVMGLDFLIFFLYPLSDDLRKMRMFVHDESLDVPVEISVKVVSILQVLVPVLLLNGFLLFF
jgi:hypothetical protein